VLTCPQASSLPLQQRERDRERVFLPAEPSPQPLSRNGRGDQKIIDKQEPFVKSLRDLHRALQFAAKAQLCAPLFTGADDSMASTILGGYMFIIAFTLLAVTVVLLSLIGQAEFSA